MKTSFYFLLWILIYPLLGLLNSNAVNEYSFLVALFIIMGISSLLKVLMANTVAYEKALQETPILEDVFTGNVESFQKRLSKEALLETVSALYYVIAIIAFLIIPNYMNGFDYWFMLIVFTILGIRTIACSVKLLTATSQLKDNPTSEQRMEIAEDTFKLDYSAYYAMRCENPYSELLPTKPRYYSFFKFFSLIVATIVIILGLFYTAMGIIIMCGDITLSRSAFSGMIFLYGSLAAYYGIRDFISCIRSKASVVIDNDAQKFIVETQNK